MSTIFISHSSRDRELAADLKRRLAQRNHHSLFLDFDPEHGIVAGQSWEQTLYRKLRACRAVIALCTDHYLGSQWCFAEIALARMEGKHLFAIQADPLSASAQIPTILTHGQLIDLRKDPEEGYTRLWKGLEEMDLLGVAGEWDPKTSPYLGLSAYQEEHAPLFFGREDEARAGLELLARGAPKLILVLGASGSGKSSLVRAGMLPRLRRDRDWLVVEPFRPGRDPFAELAESLAQTWRRYAPEQAPGAGDADRIRERLEAWEPGTTPLVDLAVDLQRAARKRDARVLLTIDQLEEALGREDGRADRFLALLRASLEADPSPLAALGTMRSDLLGLFQRHAALRGIDFESLSLGPMRLDGMRRVIEEPAKLGAVELETGLADRLIEDTETPDALPLLSFTLWVLWRDYSEDGKIEVREYEGLGGLHGAVAREADALLAAAARTGQSEALRKALLRMARLTEEGQYARRPVPWEAPELRPVQGTLERFAERRLLVFRAEGEARTVEVAHEALFRSWAPLVAWLADDRADLLLRQQIRRDAAAWLESGRDAGSLWTGGRLQQAGELTRKVELEEPERQFVRAALRRRQLRRWTLAGVTAAVFAMLSGFLVYAVRARDRAEEATARAQNFARAGIGSSLIEFDPTPASLLLLEVAGPDSLPFVMAALHEALTTPLLTVLHSQSEVEIAQSFNRDGTLVATVGANFHTEEAMDVTIWDAQSGRQVRPLGPVKFGSVTEFSPTRDHLLGIDVDGAVKVWDGGSGATVFKDEVTGVGQAWFADDGSRILTWSLDGTARVLDAVSGREVSSFELSIGLYDSEEEAFVALDGEELAAFLLFPKALMALHFDGRRIAATTAAGTVGVWNADSGEASASVGFKRSSERVLAFNLGAGRVLTFGEDKELRLADLASGELIAELGEFADCSFARFSPDGRRVALLLGEPHEEDQRGLVLDFTDPGRGPTAQVWLQEAPKEVAGLLFTRDGSRVFSFGDWEGRTGVWDVGTGRLLMTVGGSAMAVSADGSKVAALRKFIGLKGGGGTYPTQVQQAPADAELTHEAGEGCGWCDAALAASRRADPKRVVRSDGQRIAEEVTREAAGEGTEVTHVELRDARGELIRTIRGGRPRFSPDGRRLVILAELTATVWETDRGRPLSLLAGHAGEVTDAIFSPDGNWVLTDSNYDKTTRVWHAESGIPIATLPWDGWGPPIPPPPDVESARAIALSPDGARLVMSSAEGRRIWALSGTLLQALIRSRTNLCLEPELRRQNLGESRAQAWETFARCEACQGRCIAPDPRMEWLGESEDEATREHQACLRRLEESPAERSEPGLEETWDAWQSCLAAR